MGGLWELPSHQPLPRKSFGSRFHTLVCNFDSFIVSFFRLLTMFPSCCCSSLVFLFSLFLAGLGYDCIWCCRPVFCLKFNFNLTSSSLYSFAPSPTPLPMRLRLDLLVQVVFALVFAFDCPSLNLNGEHDFFMLLSFVFCASPQTAP